MQYVEGTEVSPQRQRALQRALCRGKTGRQLQPCPLRRRPRLNRLVGNCDLFCWVRRGVPLTHWVGSQQAPMRAYLERFAEDKFGRVLPVEVASYVNDC